MYGQAGTLPKPLGATVKRGEREVTGFPLSSAGGGGGLLRLRRPSWRREVEKTVDLSLAGSLGPRYLGLVSWRQRRSGALPPLLRVRRSVQKSDGLVCGLLGSGFVLLAYRLSRAWGDPGSSERGVCPRPMGVQGSVLLVSRGEILLRLL